MKRVWMVPLLVAVGFWAGRWTERPTPQAQAVGFQRSPGDLNADDQVDVSDAVFLLHYLFTDGPPPAPCAEAGPVSTVIIVRHAEKDTGVDPGLTELGQERARELARVLGSIQIDDLIASTLRRTQETLQPLSAAKGDLAIAEIQEPADVANRLRSLPGGSVAVVAHHSYTIDAILTALEVEGGENIDVGGSNYDNLIVVLRPALGPPQLLHMKYGNP